MPWWVCLPLIAPASWTHIAIDIQKAALSQALAKLDMNSISQKPPPRTSFPQVQKARAPLDYRQTNYQRYQELYSEQLTSESELANAKAEYLQALADYETSLASVNQDLANIQ